LQTAGQQETPPSDLRKVSQWNVKNPAHSQKSQYFLVDYSRPAIAAGSYRVTENGSETAAVRINRPRL
jgi:hypothetical protein